MSVLQVTNVRSNSTSFNTPVVFQTSGGTENGQLAKAWVNWNGSGTVAIRGDFNVNSVGDNGTGDYTINLSTSVVDGNLACVGACGNSSFGGMAFQTAQRSAGGTAVSTPSASAIRCTMGQANVGYQDCEQIHAIVCR